MTSMLFEPQQTYKGTNNPDQSSVGGNKAFLRCRGLVGVVAALVATLLFFAFSGPTGHLAGSLIVSSLPTSKLVPNTATRSKGFSMATPSPGKIDSRNSLTNVQRSSTLRDTLVRKFPASKSSGLWSGKDRNQPSGVKEEAVVNHDPTVTAFFGGSISTLLLGGVFYLLQQYFRTAEEGNHQGAMLSPTESEKRRPLGTEMLEGIQVVAKGTPGGWSSRSQTKLECGQVPSAMGSPAFRVATMAIEAEPEIMPLRKTSHLVSHLRRLLVEKGLAAFHIPTSDPHMSEYIPGRYTQGSYISNFTGSAGTAVITRNEALLWTDGRYHLQGSQELEAPCWSLMKAGNPGVPTVEDWLAENLDKDDIIGIDAWVLSADVYKALETALSKKKKKGLQLQAVDNLVDAVWKEEKDADLAMPSMPTDNVFVHEVQYAGKTVEDKLKEVADKLKASNSDLLLVTALDDVAWLLNLRGSDIAFNPVFYAYCIVDASGGATIFIDSAKLTDAVKAHLDAAKVKVLDYSSIESYLANNIQDEVQISYDPKKCNIKLQQVMDANPKVNYFAEPSIVSALKAIKNDVELEGMKSCHIRDGAALVKYFVWLEGEVSKGNKVTEISGAEQLLKFRSVDKKFISESFSTISSVGSNAAIIHYRAKPSTDQVIDDKNIYLLDSGGQYLDGTTDVTRTMHFGTPTEKEIEAYTLVLKGHIALATGVIPDTITGHQIDSWARAALWKFGLDYKHGTGHGVGAFLNVHEGPHGIGLRPNGVNLKPGAITSNEPGYYEDGKFGIRIENLCFFKKAATKYEMKGVQFMCLENLTMAPIQKKLIDVNLLTLDELDYLNDYHAMVLKKVGPLLENKATRAWLEGACAPLDPLKEKEYIWDEGPAPKRRKKEYIWD